MFSFKGLMNSISQISARPQPELASDNQIEAKKSQDHMDEDTAKPAIKSKKFSDRVVLFERCLRPPVIRLNIVRSMAFDGIPDKAGLRSTYWKILLGYLPLQKSLWRDILHSQRESYHIFVMELVVNPFRLLEQAGMDKDAQMKEVDADGDPLGSGRDNPWNSYFQDNSLRAEIQKDVARTHSGMHFFQQYVDYTDVAPASMLSSNGTLKDETKGCKETHHDVLTRILFVYAKLNPGIRYVQGMNELLAPLYYVFARDPDPSFKLHAEADSFFCFMNLMSEVKDRFIQSLDGSDSGIVACIEAFRNVLRRADPELFLHLESKEVSAQFYSLRWLTLLLSQEFPLPEVLRLWDSLLADPRRFDFLNYVCCSLLVDIRQRLLASSYAETLQLLQRYPPTDLNCILDTAVAIRNKMTKRLFFSEKS